MVSHGVSKLLRLTTAKSFVNGAPNTAPPEQAAVIPGITSNPPVQWRLAGTGWATNATTLTKAEKWPPTPPSMATEWIKAAHGFIKHPGLNPFGLGKDAL